MNLTFRVRGDGLLRVIGEPAGGGGEVGSEVKLANIFVGHFYYYLACYVKVIVGLAHEEKHVRVVRRKLVVF